MIRSQFGTFRGIVRLALSYPQVAFGLSGQRKPDPVDIRRMVFVCQGNICRSAFAEAKARFAGINAASFGLSAHTGGHAHEPAIAAARTLGIDLTQHKATDIADYLPQPGDLLLAMEVRQLHRLAMDARLMMLPRLLLGAWMQPAMPHLHDPYGLDDLYMTQCLKRVALAIDHVALAFPGTKTSGNTLHTVPVRHLPVDG